MATNEIISKRTECSKIFDNGDGTRTLVAGVQGKAIHYKESGRNTDEEWLDIDLSDIDNIQSMYILTRNEDGIGYTFNAREDADESVNISMMGVDVSNIEAVKSSNNGVERITWSNILTDCDVYMEPKPHRFGIFKVLKSVNAPTSFSFSIDSMVPQILIQEDGTELAMASIISKLIDGEVLTLKEAAFINSMLPPGLAWDSQGNIVEVNRTLSIDDLGENIVLTEQVVVPETMIVNEEIVPFDNWPVTVDTDVSYYASTSDGTITYTYFYAVDNTSNSKIIGSDGSDENKCLFPFDTSGLPDGTIVSSATLKLYFSNIYEYFDDTIQIVGYTGSVPLTANASSWGAFGSTVFASTNSPAAGYNSFSLNSSGISEIDDSGTTLLGLTQQSNEYGEFTVYFSEYTGTSRDPLIEITYIAGTQYTVSLTADPSSYGTVSGDGSYYNGTTVNISASANTGYLFVNWTDDDDGDSEVSTQADYEFTMPEADVNYTANFEVCPQHSVSVSASPSAGGSVSGGGTYYEGDSVTVEASANSGYVFVNWTESGTEVSANASYNFTLGTSNRTLMANFVQQSTFEVTLSPSSYTSNSWSNPANAYSSDNSYASKSLNWYGSVTGRWGGFGFDDEIPEGATIDKVEILVEYKCSTTAGNISFGTQCYVDGSGIGSRIDDTSEPTSDTIITHDHTVAKSWTRDDLLDDAFTVYIRGYNSGFTSTTVYIDHIQVRVTYTVVSENKPTITITNCTTTEISSVSGKDQCTVTFQSDTDLINWIAKADGTGHTTGITVGSGTTETANTDIQFVIDDEELTSGDKDYTITVYGENAAGWSDE